MFNTINMKINFFFSFTCKIHVILKKKHKESKITNGSLLLFLFSDISVCEKNQANGLLTRCPLFFPLKHTLWLILFSIFACGLYNNVAI